MFDPLRGYATDTWLPNCLVRADSDTFHVVKLDFAVVGEVRRHFQQETLACRGHKGDLLYKARHPLRKRADRLNAKAAVRLQARLAAGGPCGNVTRGTWICAKILSASTPIRPRAAAAPPMRSASCLTPSRKPNGWATPFRPQVRNWDTYQFQLLLHCGGIRRDRILTS